MVELGNVGEVGTQMLDKAVSGAVWLVGGLIVGGTLAALMYWFLIYKKKFDIYVKIISQRAEDNNNIIFDKAAILTERKTGKRYFRLWNFKIDMPIPKFEVLQKAGNIDYLEIYQRSDESFYFLKPAKINKTEVIKSDGSLVPLAEQEHKQMDTDIAYWNVKRKTENKSIFNKDKTWMKLLELAPQILSIIVLIFILWIFLDKLPAILNSLQSVAKEINQFGQPTQAISTPSYFIPLLIN